LHLLTPLYGSREYVLSEPEKKARGAGSTGTRMRLRPPTKLQLRRERERKHPGYKVCRKCDRLVPEGELLASQVTPYCRECRRLFQGEEGTP